MKQTKRKQMRIVLSAEEMSKIEERKAKLEQERCVKITDAQFVAGLVRWALSQ